MPSCDVHNLLGSRPGWAASSQQPLALASVQRRAATTSLARQLPRRQHGPGFPASGGKPELATRRRARPTRRRALAGDQFRQRWTNGADRGFERQAADGDIELHRIVSRAQTGRRACRASASAGWRRRNKRAAQSRRIETAAQRGQSHPSSAAANTGWATPGQSRRAGSRRAAVLRPSSLPVVGSRHADQVQAADGPRRGHVEQALGFVAPPLGLPGGAGVS